MDDLARLDIDSYFSDESSLTAGVNQVDRNPPATSLSVEYRSLRTVPVGEVVVRLPAKGYLHILVGGDFVLKGTIDQFDQFLRLLAGQLFFEAV